MTRASPQINIFAVGFALTVAVGVVMLAIQMNEIQGPLMRLFELLGERLSELVGGGLRAR